MTVVKGWFLAFNVISLPQQACSCNYIDNNMLVTILSRHWLYEVGGDISIFKLFWYYPQHKNEKKKTNWTILNCSLTFVLIIRIGDFQSYSNEIDACHKMCSHYIIFCCELVRCLHKTRARWFLYWIIHWNSRDNQLLPTLDSSV